MPEKIGDTVSKETINKKITNHIINKKENEQEIEEKKNNENESNQSLPNDSLPKEEIEIFSDNEQPKNEPPKNEQPKNDKYNLEIVSIIAGIIIIIYNSGDIIDWWEGRVETYLYWNPLKWNPLMRQINKGISPINPPLGYIIQNDILKNLVDQIRPIPGQKRKCCMNVIVGQNDTGIKTFLFNIFIGVKI